jgi:phosphate-selective porin OprO/OprP
MNASAKRWAPFAALALTLVLAQLAVAPAASADDDPWSYKWSNGFKLDSPDKAFKLKFGGRIQADYTFADADASLGSVEDGFEFRRARLFFSGTIYERFEFKAQYDFNSDGPEFKDVYIGIKNDWGSVRFGHYKEYFSLEELTSSKYLAFLERSLPIQAFSPSRNSGIGFHGDNGDKFNWGIGAFYDSDDFGVSTDEDNVNITGRIAFRPLYEDKGARMFHIGLSATQKDRASSIRFRARPEAHLTGRFVDTGTFAADSATIFDLELAAVANSFWFAGEYVTADVDTPFGSDPSFDGYYVQAGYYLTGEHRRYKTSSGAFDRQKPKENFLKDGGRGAWELAFRFSSLDLNDGLISGGEQEDWTLGVNWYPNPATRQKINWVHADVENEGEADFFLVRWQIDF